VIQFLSSSYRSSLIRGAHSFRRVSAETIATPFNLTCDADFYKESRKFEGSLMLRKILIWCTRVPIYIISKSISNYLFIFEALKKKKKTVLLRFLLLPVLCSTSYCFGPSTTSAYATSPVTVILFYRGVLHSRNVVDDFTNLFENVQKFEINIEIWKLEIRSKRNLIGFAVPAILCTIKTCKN